MNTDEQKGILDKPLRTENQAPRKTIYDGIKITKKGIDITIAIISAALISLFIIALSK